MANESDIVMQRKSDQYDFVDSQKKKLLHEADIKYKQISDYAYSWLDFLAIPLIQFNKWMTYTILINQSVK